MSAETIIYVSVDEAADLLKAPAYEVEALIDSGVLDAREHNGFLLVSRVSAIHLAADRFRTELREMDRR